MKSDFLALSVAVTCFFPRIHPQLFVSASEDNGGDLVGVDLDGGDDPFVIAGYLPEYRAYIDIDAAAIHLTDLMLFSLTPESIMKYSSQSGGGCCLSSEHYDKIREAKSYKRNHHQRKNEARTDMRLFVTIGGGGRSDGFGHVVAGDSQVQLQFMEGIIQLW